MHWPAPGYAEMRYFAKAAVVLAFAAQHCAALAVADPLETSARISTLAQQRLVTSLSAVDDKLIVAVGQRGHALRSTDGGRSWAQARVPLSSDLTAVQMVDQKVGFAAGHDGTVLRTDDGGASWIKLLDGRAANKLVQESQQRKVDAAQGDEEARHLLGEARRNVVLGPDKPFLDLWFANANEGYVVGAYNLILQTRDGGRSWSSWFDRTDNPKLLNLYAIRRAQGALFAVGEAGLLLRLDEKSQRFRALASPYKGSFFGVLGTSAGVLAYGMRGNALLSADSGTSWRAIDTGLSANITGATILRDGRVLLVDQAGNLAVSDDGGNRFARMRLTWPPSPLAAVAATSSAAVLGGLRGLRTMDLPEHQ